MRATTKPLVKLPTPALAVAWLVLITARVVVFWEHRFILLALSAFFIPPISGQGLASQICFVVFLISVLSLIVIYVKRLRANGHHAAKQ